MNLKKGKTKNKDKDFIRIEEEKNYIIKKIREVPKNKVIKYRRKEIKSKDGRYTYILNIAVVRNNSKTKTVLTSIWFPKGSPKARKYEKYLKERKKNKKRKIKNTKKRR